MRYARWRFTTTLGYYGTSKGSEDCAYAKDASAEIPLCEATLGGLASVALISVPSAALMSDSHPASS